MNIRWFKSLILASILLCISAAESPAQTISTAAGAGSQGSQGDGGVPTAAYLNLPSAVWSDTLGTLFIADTGNNRIRRINAARDSIATFAGTGSAAFSGDNADASSAALNAPGGVFVDSTGIVYVADTGNHRIRRIDTSGIITTIAGKDTTAGLFIDDTLATQATLSAPTAVFARGGFIYIADTGNNRVRRIDNGGFITTLAGKDTTAGLFIDNTLATQATLNQPRGLYVDRSLNVYIADTNNHRIRKFSASDSVLTTFAGSENAGFSGDGDLPSNAHLAFPTAVVVDTFGTAYIADRFNHRIRRVNPSGNITTVSGLGYAGYEGDAGPANRAALSAPHGLFLRGDTLFVTDQSNHRLRKIVPDNSMGLSNSTTLGPGREAQLMHIALAGDGQTTVKGLTFTLSDLSTPTGLSSDDFSEFRLYESYDAALGDDLLLGQLDAREVTLGDQTTVYATTLATPRHNTDRYYILAALLSKTSTQGHAMRIAAETGALATSAGGRGARIRESDSDRLIIDAVATQLVLRTQPSDGQSGNPLLSQPTVEALDDSGFVDFDFHDTLFVTASGYGTLLHNMTIASAGTASFSNLTYTTPIDDEQIQLTVKNSVDNNAPGLLSVVSDAIRINVENDSPVVDLPGFVFNEDDPIGFRTLVNDIVSDIDDSTLTITFQSRNRLASIVGDSLIILPPANFFGVDTLTITATDAYGLTHSDSGIIEVRPSNDAPQINSNQLETVEDETLYVDMQTLVNDADNAFGDLALSISSLSDLSLDYDEQAGRLTLWAPADSSGLYSFHIRAEDPYSTSVSDTVYVAVLPRNDPPLLSLRDTTVLQGSSVEIDLAQRTADIDDLLTNLQWSSVDDSLMSIALSPSGVATIQPDSTFYGERNLIFSVQDASQTSAHDTLRLTVIRVNRPPVTSIIPDREITAGDSLTVDLSAFGSDPDDPQESLIWSAAAERLVQTELDGSLLHLVAPAGTATYSEDILVYLTDGRDTSQTTLRVHVVAPQSPLVAPIPDILLQLDQTLTVNLSPYLSTEVSQLTAEHDSLQTAIDLQGRTIDLRAPPGFKRESILVLRAETARGAAGTDTILVSVNNPAPQLFGFPDFYLDPGTAFQISLDDYAEDDEPLSNLRWSALPDAGVQISIHGTLHIATIRADRSAEDLRRIAFTATDAQGASTTDTLRIFVHEATGADTLPVPVKETNTPPSLDALPPIELVADGQVTIEIEPYATDDAPVSQLIWSASVVDTDLLTVAIDASKTATITALGNAGQAQVILTATDRGGLQVSTAFQVVIQAPPTDFGEDEKVDFVEPLPADFDGNGKIDFEDFFLFVESIGSTPLHTDWDPAFDLNYDGQINIEDFFMFADAFEAFNRSA